MSEVENAAAAEAEDADNSKYLVLVSFII